MPDGGSGSAGDKTSWPELVGWDKAEAKAQLETTTTKTVFLVPQGSVVTMDFNMDRVRIMYDTATNKVSSTPRIG